MLFQKMNILYQIYSFTQIIWFFPPLRQQKTKYFFYFLLLPIIETVAIFNHYFHLHLFVLQNILSVFSLVSVLEKKIIRKIWPLAMLFFLCAYGWFFGIITNNIIFICIQSLILGIFIKQFILTLFDKKVLNIFILLLVFYEITVITKTFNLITGFTDANFYYVITSIFDFFIGIFFCIFKENSKRMLLILS